ncbi:hypothetical protein pipiens_006668 [Culex pipiens pipiens]|uniref:Uncharacterized protein n=1 Tax=Culex pipiens pipiens TaxID=38569 RepID=A0ABD1DNM0_CULPP
MVRSISSRLRPPGGSSGGGVRNSWDWENLRPHVNYTPRFGSNDVHQVNLPPPTATPGISPTDDARYNPNGVKC